MAAVRRLEDGVRMPVLMGRNSKRRFRGTLEWERTRHRRVGIAGGVGGKVGMEV